MCRCGHQFRTTADKISADELAAATKAFEMDAEIIQDRMTYRTFEKMPLALQWWWVDRAAYLSRLAATIS